MTTEEQSLWNSKIQVWKREIQQLIIPPDMDPMTAKNILHKLSLTYDQVRPEYGDILKKYKQTDQYMELVKNKNLTGTNDAERKRNSYCALEAYTSSDGSIINLIKLFADIEGKKQDLESLLDMIDKKTSICITMSGFMKVEASLSRN